MIRVDGHTAALPENPDYHVSDRDLSSERANAVLKHFEDNVGIRGDRLSALAFGKFRPIASNDDEAERRLNRRIEIMVTEANNITMQLDAIYEKLVD
jgi:chemotaxis protein MotB